jgi:hypothetical protein
MLVGRTQVGVDEHVLVADNFGQFLEEAHAANLARRARNRT